MTLISPDTLDPTQVQNFLLYLTQERQLAWSSVSVAASAIPFFYTETLKRLDLATTMPPASEAATPAAHPECRRGGAGILQPARPR